MGVYPLWKYIIVVIVLFFSLIYSLPNLYESYPSIELKGVDTPLTKQQISNYSDTLKNNKIDVFEIKKDKDRTHYIFDNLDNQPISFSPSLVFSWSGTMGGLKI